MIKDKDKYKTKTKTPPQHIGVTITRSDIVIIIAVYKCGGKCKYVVLVLR